MMDRRDAFVTFDEPTKDGHRWFFHYQAENGEPIFQSEPYNSAEARDKGIVAARKCHDAPVKARA
jgi:uncharacterized protein YegP (UPF0339 family)